MNDLVRNALMGTAGGAVEDGEFVDNLFAAHFYTGVPGGSATVNNGIDLSGSNEGMVWVKNRYATSLQLLYDTIRGGGNAIYPDRSDAQGSQSDGPATFTSNGFTTGSAPSSQHISWTFKTQEKFFDVVTYTGNNTAGRQIPHNLGSVPGAILVKNINNNVNWVMYHRGTDATAPQDYWMAFNQDYARQNQPHWNDTAPTSTHFTVGNDYEINGPASQSYVAYLFAHDEAAFGYRGNNSIIKCGNYTGNGSSNGPDINLGWEPQWLLIKRTNATEDWMLFDHMRTSGRQDMWLDDQRPNKTSLDGDGAGTDSQPFLNWTSTGFKLSSLSNHTNGNGDNYIYIAVRRPDGYVGELPTTGTQVFTPVADSSGAPCFKTPNHYVDMSLQKNSNYATGSSATWNVVNRLRSNEIVQPDSSNAEFWNQYHVFDYQNGESNFTGGSGIRFSWNWKRYAGFDVVYYKGTGVQQWINHSLNQKPEFFVVKCVDWSSGGWRAYHKDLASGHVLRFDVNGELNDPAGFGAGDPTSKTQFRVNTDHHTNSSNGWQFIALLWSSVDGISKVGSYTGTGYDLTVTTGFSPRFVIIKRIDANENWFVLDTVRGWASGNDQYVILNNTDQQASADFGNPVASGFLVKGTSSGTNTSGGTYIYYAHA